MSGEDFTKVPVCAPCKGETREVAWGLQTPDSSFAPLYINRMTQEVRDYDVVIEMHYCGICHTDVHHGKNHLKVSKYPIVPGHELAGVVTAVGAKVTKVKVGDKAGVGCLVGSCMACEYCDAGEEQQCMKGAVPTYNGMKNYDMVPGDQSQQTFGGYSATQVVHEKFCIHLADNIDLSKAGPLLCAGITMYDPLKYWGLVDGPKGKVVGVAGIGGLGTMGIKLAKALGHRAMAISTNPAKEQLCREKGADFFCCTKDEESLKANAAKCHIILNTISGDHDVNTYLPLMRKNAQLVQLGLTTKPHPVNQLLLMRNRWQITGNGIGGIRNTQEVADLCAKNGIYPECKVIDASGIDDAWKALEGFNADAIRYVIDIRSSLKDPKNLPAA